MKWVITVKPDDIFTYPELARKVRPASTLDQDYIMELQEECTAYAEEKMECSLMPRTITATYWHNDVGDNSTTFPVVSSLDYSVYLHHHRHALALPRGPVLSVTSVKDSDGNDVAYTLQRVGNSDHVRLTQNAVKYPVTIVYVAGYATAGDIPADIRGMIRTHVVTNYMIPEAVVRGTISTTTNIDEFYCQRGRGKPVY